MTYGALNGNPVALATSAWTLYGFNYSDIVQALAPGFVVPATDPISAPHNYVMTSAEAKALGLQSTGFTGNDG